MLSPHGSENRAFDAALSPRHHLLIAGTGRAGTSLLVKILGACGLETALNRTCGPLWYESANAGVDSMPGGGAEIFALFLPLANRIELTEVLDDVAGDTVMADPRAKGGWREVGNEDHPAENGQPHFRFVTLERL